MTITHNTALPFRIILLAVFIQGYLTAPDLRQLKSYNHRQIEPYACYDQITKDEGICMFAWNCKRANGTHLTFCMDRFYFGSCCRLPPEYYIKADTTTTEVPTETTTAVSESTSASPIVSVHTTLEAVSVSSENISTKENNLLSTRAVYPTPSTFAPGLVTWRPLEAPHDIPNGEKRKPTTPMLSSTADKSPIEYVMKTKTSTEQPFPSYPSVFSSNTKPPYSHGVKIPKPIALGDVKVTKPSTQRPEASSSITPQRVVHPKPTAGQGVKAPRPPTPRTTDLPKSTKPHLTEIPTLKIETTTESVTPAKSTLPDAVELSTPTTAQPLQKVSEPNEAYSPKPHPINLQGVPHEAPTWQPPVQQKITTPKPTAHWSDKITYPPHIVELLQPGSSPSSLDIQEPEFSVKTEESTTMEDMITFTTPVSETFPAFPEPAKDSLESQQLASKENFSEPSFIEVISTEVEELSSQKGIEQTTRTTQVPAVEVTTSRFPGLGDVFQVTSFLSKEGSPEDSSVETTITSSTTSDQEEYDASLLTHIPDSDASVTPVRETEDSDVPSTTQETALQNITEILHLSPSDVTYDTTLHEITEKYGTDLQSPTKETQYSTSSYLPQTTLTVFDSTQTDKEIQSQYSDFSEPPEKLTETDVESFPTTPFKCKTSTKHSGTESDLMNPEESADVQQDPHISIGPEEDSTKDSSASESDMAHVTSAGTTPTEELVFSHIMTETTGEEYHSSLPVSPEDPIIVSVEETEPSYAGSTEDDWDSGHSFISKVGSEDTYESSDFSLAGEVKTQTPSDFSWTLVTTGNPEGPTLSEETTAFTKQQINGTFETSKTSESEDYSGSDVSKGYISEATAQKQSTKEETYPGGSEFSFLTSTLDTKSDIWTDLQSQTSTFEYDSVNLTRNTEGETFTIEKLSSAETEQPHALDVTHSEFMDATTSTKTPTLHTEETFSVKDDIFTSTALVDSDLTSERYVQSSSEESKLSTDFTRLSTSTAISDNDFTSEKYIHSSVEESGLSTESSTQSASTSLAEHDSTSERYIPSVEETRLDTESTPESTLFVLDGNDLTSERYVYSSVEETELNTEFSLPPTLPTLFDNDLTSERYVDSSVEETGVNAVSSTSSTLGAINDHDLTSERFVHSSAEETELSTESFTESTTSYSVSSELNTKSSTQSTTSYSSPAHEDHSTEDFGKQDFTPASLIHDSIADSTKDATAEDEYVADVTSTISSDVFSELSVTQSVTDQSGSMETIQPLQKITSEEAASPTIFENTSEQYDVSFTTYKEKTENPLSHEYTTKHETQETSMHPDVSVTTSEHTLANDEISDSESVTFSSTILTGNDSLHSDSQSFLSTAESQSVTEQSTTYPSTPTSTQSTVNVAETFSVDVDFGTDITSLSETSRTTQTEQDTSQTFSEYQYTRTPDITVKYVTSIATYSDSDNFTTATERPVQTDISTIDTSSDSSDASAETIETTSMLEKNTTFIVETTRPWEDIAAGVIEMLQGAESHPSSPKTTPPSVHSSTSSTSGIPEEPTTIDLSSADYTQVCGRPLPGPVGRIVGGGPAHFGEWPWVVSLRQWKKNTFLHKCGAALVNEFWVITAAHCIEGVPLTDILLRLGEYDITNEEEPLPFVERRIQIVAAHPKFDKRTFEYDLALLRFYEPVTFQRNILPICIPEGNNSYVGKFATVAGWGRMYEDGPLPNVIQEVALPVITNDLCEEMYRKAGFVEDIPDIFICAGYGDGGKDSCEGDSGGPMVIQEDDGRWVLAGVISWGIGCALPNQPGVYTRITKFSKWINQIIVF